MGREMNEGLPIRGEKLTGGGYLFGPIPVGVSGEGESKNVNAHPLLKTIPPKTPLGRG